MRALQSRSGERRADVAAADLSATVAGLFSRWPILEGFSVQDRATLGRDRTRVSLDGALCIADIVVRTWPGYDAGTGLYEDLADALLELLDERPEAGELLRGTTFARSFH